MASSGMLPVSATLPMRSPLHKMGIRAVALVSTPSTQGQGAGGVRRREQTALLYRAGINGSERSFNGVPRCSGRSHHAVPVRNGDGRAAAL